MSSPVVLHHEIEMSQREKELMTKHNLMTDKDGNLVPCDIPASSSNGDLNLGRSITINIDELALLLRNSNYRAPAPPAPPSGLGNPGPLGLGGFALTTFVLSVFNTGVIIDPSLEPVVLPLALFYGGLAQFIAGLFEFRAPNTFGATAFCSYGAFWLSFAAYVKYVVPGLRPDITNEATGLFLFVWMLFSMYMFVASLRVSKVITLVFFFLVITFILLMVGALAESTSTSHAGGWFGLITAVIAWYGSAAVVINSTFGRTVCPVGVYIKEESFIDSWTSFGKSKKTIG